MDVPGGSKRVGQGDQEGASLTLPPAEQDAPLAFYSTRDRYWQTRLVSAFPEKASPGMFPGSRLRGPFSQIYPRPFPVGGQP